MNTSINPAPAPAPAVASGPIRRSAEDYRKLTDAQIKVELRRIENSSNSEDEFKRRVREELGCLYTPAVTSCTNGRSIMFMYMVNGPRGNVFT